MLADPGDRVVVAGADRAQVAAGLGTRRIDDWATISAAIPPPGIGPTELIAFAVIAAIALAPIVIFVASVARVGQRRRDERAAALRLLGAGSRQLAVLAAAEAGLAGVAGAVLGVLAVEALGLRSSIEFWSVSVFTDDLLLSAGIVLLTLCSCRCRRRHGLGVARPGARAAAADAPPRRPAGAGHLAARPGAGRLGGDGVPAGLVAQRQQRGGRRDRALGGADDRRRSRAVGRLRAAPRRPARAPGPGAAATIAGRRLEADAVGGFRAISGLAVAFAVATAGLVVGASLRLQDVFVPPIGVQALGSTADAWLDLPAAAGPAARVTRAATATPGVVAGATVRFASSSPGGQVVGADCRELATVLAGAISCPAQAGALVPASAGPVGGTIAIDRQDASGAALEPIEVTIAGHLPDALSIAGVAPAVVIPADVAQRAAPDGGTFLLLSTDHDPLTLDRLAGNVAHETVTDLTVSSTARPARSGPSTVARVERILTGITLLALVVAAIGLAIGAIDALVARRRTLAHLAATGVSARTLRAATAIELVAPMLTAVCLAFVLGVGIGATFYRLYYGPGDIVVPWGRAGLLLALAFLAAAAVAAVTLPVVARASRPDQLRTE